MINFIKEQEYETIKTIEKQDKEIQRLKNGYCELKEKCNNGECDCTNEEYDGMVESNMKLSLEVERLKRENNDLKKIYRNTYNKLFENGNDELARYFQAQIDDCPTFYVEPIIDYYEENQKLNNMIKIMESYLELIYDLGCDYDGCNTIKSLKELINELTRFASLGRACNITEPIFSSNNKKYNILGEELEGKSDE